VNRCQKRGPHRKDHSQRPLGRKREFQGHDFN
jgi:hypothetical protein